jgi:hypothetical protein
MEFSFQELPEEESLQEQEETELLTMLQQQSGSSTIHYIYQGYLLKALALGAVRVFTMMSVPSMGQKIEPLSASKS